MSNSVRRSRPRASPSADERDLFGLLVLGPDDLTRLGAGAPANTDDHPHVLFEGPRFTYQRGVPPYRLLGALLERESTGVRNALGGDAASGEPGGERRLAGIRRTIEARDLYLRARITEREQGWERAVPQYEASVRASAAFTPSLARLAAIGQHLMKTDPPRGRALLARLEAARPGVR